MNEKENLASLFPDLVSCDLTVENLDLEVAVKNSLRRGGIHTLAQLLKLTHTELAAVFPNRRLRSYEDVIYRLVCLSEGEKMTDTPDSGTVVNIENTIRPGQNLVE